jgi:hypothetical protein
MSIIIALPLFVGREKWLCGDESVATGKPQNQRKLPYGKNIVKDNQKKSRSKNIFLPMNRAV